MMGIGSMGMTMSSLGSGMGAGLGGGAGLTDAFQALHGNGFGMGGVHGNPALGLQQGGMRAMEDGRAANMGGSAAGVVSHTALPPVSGVRRQAEMGIDIWRFGKTLFPCAVMVLYAMLHYLLCHILGLCRLC